MSEGERGAVIGVAGALPSRKGGPTVSRIPYLDMVMTLPFPCSTIITKIEVSGERVCETGFDPEGTI